MGWTVLYIAFGFVALWLLGEVLLQYKARLRWRLLAFFGFLGVVVGVLLASVIVIGVGAIAFAIGQTYVTLSFRRGFSTGWAIGGNPGASRRRRSGGDPAARPEPTLEVSDLAYEPVPEAEAEAERVPGRETAEAADVYEPQPLPDETGQYGVYRDSAFATAAQNEQNGGYDANASAYAGYYDPQGQNQDAYSGQYDYGTGQQQYAAYSDPYIGTQQYSPYDYGTGQQQYAEPYAQPQYSETPPGGVWVPQQRDGEQPYAAGDEQGYPYQNGQNDGQDTGDYNEQYRY
ncbi:hypothetical protein NLX86_04225 [Streptomyces sp. A3M-1-3]|uniref:hypothetical protein n=1 Tax=Streptomyces sp. A3M-1-3 TaxID=2962044 RepID=UPI0020B6C200|nr:hypothetical protein [Streptomyces sp. A3M-1-3]MCP3817373.1 hypothetical protein [Streptomyces sp. A3M-1-3]